MQKRARLSLSVLFFLALGLQGSAEPTVGAGFLGAYTWTMSDPLFGGFSGIQVSKDGKSLVSISDKGSSIRAQIQRDASGRITRVTGEKVKRLKDADGTDLARKKGASDSEGLAIAPDGTIYVSFEGRPRVMRFATLDSQGQDLPILPAFKKLPRNAAFEALAVDAKGRVYTMPEEPKSSMPVRLLTGQAGNPSGPDFPIWRFDGQTWTQAYTLPRRGNLLPVGADFGPDGRLYILEREFRGLGGFGSRVRSFKLGARGLEGERTEMQSQPGRHDNLEGLAVWQNEAGQIHLTLISDDNFLSVQRTEIVEYRLTH